MRSGRFQSRFTSRFETGRHGPVALGKGGGGGDDGLQPTTLEISISHGLATYYFDKPVRVGTYADGQPFAVSDQAFNVTQVTPDSAAVLSDAYTTGTSDPGTPVSPTNYDANGLMVNPWFGSDTTQGFDGLLGVYAKDSGQIVATSPYSASLNKDPALAGAYAVNVGDEASLVKSVRASGLTTPSGSWIHFDDLAVMHIVAAVPPLGAYAPAVCATSKTSTFTRAKRNKTVLPGFTPSSGMPTLDTASSGKYLTPFSLNPMFARGPAGGADAYRRYFANTYTALHGYSREYGLYFADYVAGLLAAGSGVDDAYLDPALAISLQLLGMVDKNSGHWGSAGAGQWCGHVQFAMLAGFMFDAAVAGTLNKALQVEGNCNGQQYWVTSGQVGIATSWPGNHNYNKATHFPENVDKPWWDVNRVASGTLDLDGEVAADYEDGGGSGGASFPEMLNCALLKNGPSGKDGSQVMLRGGAADKTNPYASSLAYYDRYRSFKNDVYATTTFRQSRHTAYWDDRRGDCAVARWTGTPDAFTPQVSSQGPYLAAISGGFSWDWTSAENATETILEWQTQYSQDAKTWVDVATQAVSGTQTSLTIEPHYVRFRRRSASGWGPWSFNHKRHSDDSNERFVVTPTGTPSNSAPAFAVDPAIFKARYTNWAGPSWTDATGNTLTSAEVAHGMEASKGYVTGYPDPTVTYQKRIAGSLVGSAASSPVIADDNDDDGQSVTADVALTNTGGSASKTTAALTWYGVPGGTELAALLARVNGSAPSSGRQTAMSDLIAALKTTGVWAKLDCFYDFTLGAATGNNLDSKLNWKGAFYDATDIGTVSFSANGATVAAGTNGLDSGFNPSTDTSRNFQRNSASIGAWFHDNWQSTTSVMGNATNLLLQPRRTASQASARINGANGPFQGSGVTDVRGLCVGTRTGANQSDMYKAGSNVATNSSEASTAPANSTIQMLCSHATTIAHTQRLAFIGGGLSAQENADLYTALANYMVAIGF